ncbi:hypothetical protein [Butyrivibrio sp. WCD3002]|uniref:hypothetical protein n=1 Tax=Butyrivibrio sp. WCD3002 TaxID=1280676 RepID=UPI0018C9FD76|nr:hypothetical protein [Butyrivibrio sp. WCD3002]
MPKRTVPGGMVAQKRAKENRPQWHGGELTMTIQELLQEQIDKIYGVQAGKKTGSVLIPAFLGDYRKVLEKSNLGVTTSEEYMTEDKLMHLVFTGQRRMGAKGFDFIVTSCVCNDKELLSEELPLFSSIV